MTTRFADGVADALALAALAVLALALAGCSSTPQGGDVNDAANPVDWEFFSPISRTSETQAVRRALVVGWRTVDPRAWDGWDGACPGVDRDVENMAALCELEGFAVAALRDARATRARLRQAFAEAVEGLRAGDLLFVSVSGHGGIEGPGMQYLCAWDGRIADRTIYEFLCRVPAGVRVAAVVDTCHSAGMPRDAAAQQWVRVARQVRADGAFRGSLLLMAACGVFESALGFPDGGLWTTSLVRAWGGVRAPIYALSWGQWFGVAKGLAGTDRQTPTLVELGPSFRGGPAMR